MLRAETLTKNFVLHLQGGTNIPVLRGMSLELHSGKCLALTGPSGAGKSTLMRSLYGTYLVDAGRILIWHRENWCDLTLGNAQLALEIRRETLGYVSQFLRVVPRISALDIVADAARARGRGLEEAFAEAEALLTRLNIPRRLHGLPPATFSGGEQQRVNLARGFIGRYPILLLDEPTASLDLENREIVVQMIREEKQRTTAIAGIFHDKQVRDAVSDDVLVVPLIKQAA